MFPPYSKPAGDAVKDWVDGGQAPSQDIGGNLQMVTEVWIEPQFGVINCEEKPLKYLDGLKYYEVPQAVSKDRSLKLDFTVINFLVM